MPPVEAVIRFTNGEMLRGTNAADYAFHHHCDTCAPEAEPEPLCSVCKYMRLQHLIVCLRKKIRYFSVKLKPENTTDNIITRIMRTKDCALCRVLSDGMRSRGILPDEYNGWMIDISSALLKVSLYATGETWGKRFDICYIHNSSTAIGAPGSLLESHPLMKNLVNWDRVRGWIDQSLKPYQNETSTFGKMPPGFRLIDVNKRRLTSEVESGQNLPSGGFVALSYVWGISSASPENALMRSNKQALEADGGLGQIPRTVEDAMTICERLGRRYLWVDRFCIQQDEKQEKQQQMNAMADIFSAAEFTIINASGSHMDSPIAGVTQERKAFQSKAVLPNLELINVYPDVTWAVNNSKWAERGWTYQEAVLSKKRLFFTPLQVFFECDTGTSAREDYYARRRYIPRWNEGAPVHYYEHPFEPFARHLKEYTGRFLTYPADIENTFMGIFRTLYPCETSLHGLPEPDFNQALLWYRCKRTLDGPISAREGFPSWSWASCNDQVTYYNGQFVVTLVCWAYKEQTEELKAVRCKKSQVPTGIMGFDYDLQFHLLLAWWAGCIEAAPPDGLKKELEVYSSGDKSCIMDRWPTMDRIWDEIKSRQNVGPDYFPDLNIGLTAEDQSLINKLRPGVVITHAQTAAFKIDTPRVVISSRSLIYNPNGYEAGSLWLDLGSVIKDAATGTELTITQEKVELMAVSLRGFDTSKNTEDFKELIQFVDKSFHTGEGCQWPERETPVSQPTVNVLAIERSEGSSFWRRVGYGEVGFSHWVSADRTFNTIALE